MQILRTEIYDKGFDIAVDEFVELTKSTPNNLLISPSDASVLVHARTNSEFKSVLEKFYWNLPDGMPAAWILKMKGARLATRCSGPDFFERIIKETSHLPINHFFCGGKGITAELLMEQAKKWGNNNVVGCYSPPFKDLSENELKEIARKVNDVGTSVLWVGLGTPKQIYFSERISHYTNVNFIVPIGAAFDFHTGQVKKAPRWIQNIGLEWFYRLTQEPQRLFKRYLNAIPKFIWYSLVDR